MWVTVVEAAAAVLEVHLLVKLVLVADMELVVAAPLAVLKHLAESIAAPLAERMTVLYP